jgi:hypothetical protein
MRVQNHTMSDFIMSARHRIFLDDCVKESRTQWLRGLRHELSSLAQTQGS